MTNIRQAIDVTSQLYHIRDQQVFLNGETGFIQLFESTRGHILARMLENDCDILPATISLLDEHSEDGLKQHRLLAVACEMLEPTITKQGNASGNQSL